MQLNNKITELDIDKPGSIEIEIWKYYPELFAQERVVDPLYLYLNLKSTKDERVEMALDTILEKFQWQKDLINLETISEWYEEKF